MGLLQNILTDIKAGLSHDASRVNTAAHPQFSAAVAAQNHAPVTNQWNSQGLPTQEVLSDRNITHFMPPVPRIAPVGLQAYSAPAGSMQLGGDEPYQAQDTKALYGMQPQRSNIQPDSFYMQGVQQQPYNQQAVLRGMIN